MGCENCNIEHNNNYGSGRFCSEKCARGFSSKEKRLEINKKVSLKLKGRKVGHGFTFGHVMQQGYRDKMLVSLNQTYRDKMLNTDCQFLGKKLRKRKVMEEQGNKCALCGIPEEWNGKTLCLELDHIDGNSDDNTRKNIRIICPNCHSQTPTYKAKNAKNKIKSTRRLERYKLKNAG